jgi:hypothetical protein
VSLDDLETAAPGLVHFIDSRAPSLNSRTSTTGF